MDILYIYILYGIRLRSRETWCQVKLSEKYGWKMARLRLHCVSLFISGGRAITSTQHFACRTGSSRLLCIPFLPVIPSHFSSYYAVVAATLTIYGCSLCWLSRPRIFSPNFSKRKTFFFFSFFSLNFYCLYPQVQPLWLNFINSGLT